MPGLYLHIPYCYRACSYCNFHFSTSFDSKASVIDAMKEELRIRSSEWNTAFKSVYFGGGTPSILSPAEFDELFDSIRSHLDLKEVEEITLECNPEDLISEKLLSWKRNGVNRLSIGVQTFNDDLLRSINRQHREAQAIEGIRLAKEHGFNNISIDLIMGLPGSDNDLLLYDIEKALSLTPLHISAYQLSVEEKTALDHQVKSGQVKLPDEEEVNGQFHLLHQRLTAGGFHHYEISNYALPGFEAQHNSSYWTGASYLGIGPGAHSFDGKKRRWNISNNRSYVKEINSGGTWFEGEELSEKDRYNEMIMTSLRNDKGLDLTELKDRFPDLFKEAILQEVEAWMEEGWASLKNNRIRLSMDGWLISDKLASELFIL